MSGCPAPELPAALQKGAGVRAALQTAALSLPAEPYTCGACGIQFQFYNNLLEHMQSHAGKDPAAPLPSLPPRSSKGQGQPGATPPGDSHKTWVNPVTQGSVELKKLPEAVASAWSLVAT